MRVSSADKKEFSVMQVDRIMATHRSCSVAQPGTPVDAFQLNYTSSCIIGGGIVPFGSVNELFAVLQHN